MADRPGTHPGTAGRGRRLERVTGLLINRWGSIAIPPFAVALFVYGLGFVIAPDTYTSPVYQTGVFTLVPVEGAGVVYLAVGAASLGYPHRWTAAALVAVYVSWGLTAVNASITQPDVPATAGVILLAAAVTLFLSIAARGYGAPER